MDYPIFNVVDGHELAGKQQSQIARYLPIKSIITIGSVFIYLLVFLWLYSNSPSRNAATYGVKMAVYITNIRIIQSQTALNGE